MMKAYPRVEWSYLKVIMDKLDFASQWISVVMNLASPVSFLVMFNGTKLEEFKPS